MQRYRNAICIWEKIANRSQLLHPLQTLIFCFLCRKLVQYILKRKLEMWRLTFIARFYHQNHYFDWHVRLSLHLIPKIFFKIRMIRPWSSNNMFQDLSCYSDKRQINKTKKTKISQKKIRLMLFLNFFQQKKILKLI